MAGLTKDEAETLDAIFGDLDMDGALKTFKELGLPRPLKFSEDAVNTINAAANELANEAAELKRSEAPRAERLAVRRKVDQLVNARAFLYRLRGVLQGDVTVTSGGTN